MRWLITGGAGFIGSHLADHLIAQGDQVRIIDDLSTGIRSHVPPAAEFIHADIRDLAVLEKALSNIDGCFHLAAIASVAKGNMDWLGTHAINLTAAIAIFDILRKAMPPVPLVYASSAAIYGDNPDLPLTEKHLPGPQSAYGADKLGIEMHARAAWTVHHVPSVGLRLFNVYGTRQDPLSPYTGVVARFIELAANGADLVLHGDGQQSRDFIHVSDIVRFLCAAMTYAARGGHHVFNACSGQAVTIETLARTIISAAGTGAKITFGPKREGDIRKSLGSPDEAAAQLNCRAQVDLATGLATLLNKKGTAPAS